MARRLTVDLVLTAGADASLNAVQERTVSLRGLRLGGIENLGVLSPIVRCPIVGAAPSPAPRHYLTPPHPHPPPGLYRSARLFQQ